MGGATTAKSISGAAYPSTQVGYFSLPVDEFKAIPCLTHNRLVDSGFRRFLRTIRNYTQNAKERRRDSGTAFVTFYAEVCALAPHRQSHIRFFHTYIATGSGLVKAFSVFSIELHATRSRAGTCLISSPAETFESAFLKGNRQPGGIPCSLNLGELGVLCASPSEISNIFVQTPLVFPAHHLMVLFVPCIDVPLTSTYSGDLIAP